MSIQLVIVASAGTVFVMMLLYHSNECGVFLHLNFRVLSGASFCPFYHLEGRSSVRKLVFQYVSWESTFQAYDYLASLIKQTLHMCSACAATLWTLGPAKVRWGNPAGCRS